MKNEWENSSEGYQFLWYSLVFFSFFFLFRVERKNNIFDFISELKFKTKFSNIKFEFLLIIEVMRYEINLYSPNQHIGFVRNRKRNFFKFLITAGKLIKKHPLGTRCKATHTSNETRIFHVKFFLCIISAFHAIHFFVLSCIATIIL